jgi:PAS domain S-box-containing protein
MNAAQAQEKNQSALAQLTFLTAGSEMADCIRAYDWSHSPLGPVEFWPAALLSTLSICLSARFPMAIYWGAKGHLLYNDAWRPILGNKHPWALGRSASEVWPEIWQTIDPLFETVRTTGQATWRQDELLPMHRFGYLEECYFDYSFNPITGQSKTIEGILNVVQETTFRVLSERRTRLLSELASRSATAKSEQDACRLSIEAIATDPADVPFAILCTAEPEGGLRVLASTGFSGSVPAKFKSSDDSLFVPLKPNSQPVVIKDFVEQFHLVPVGFWPEPVTQTVLLPITTASESPAAVVLIAGVNPRRHLDDNYIRFFELIASHVASTLSNAKTFEEERKRALALAELDRAKTTFFSNVSHELRTPLTLILGPLEDELRERSGPSERLELAHRNSLRLLKLVNTLLDFSRLEAGHLEASFVPTDLAAFTIELANVFRVGIERAGLRLLVDCPPLPDLVYVDRDMWEKIVFNLLSNAFKFTLEGEIEIRLHRAPGAAASTNAPNGAPGKLALPCACLTVRDTGTGIPAAELPRIFERFHRVRNSRARSHEGTGIGLALVQELVRRHGGCAGLESTEGSGTTFTIWIPLGSSHLPKDRIGETSTMASTPSGALPFMEEARRWSLENPSARNFSAAAPAATSGDEPDHQHNSQTGARILLADDNADMRDYVRRLLLGRGYDVVAVSDGEAALAAIRADPPALVLSDVMMPRLDGFGLLRALRADSRTSGIPVILVSARAGEEARTEGVEAGADDYLTKPFSARELIARVSTHVNLNRIRRDAEAKIRDTLDSITDGLYGVDAAGRISYFNATARHTIAKNNLDPDHLIGRDFFEAFPELLDVEAGRTLKQTLRERVPTAAEIFYAPWQRWFGVRHYPTADGGVSSFFQDITERKHSEEILRQNEALFTALVNLAPTGVYVVDAQFRLQQINALALPAFAKVEPKIGRDFGEVMNILWGPEVGAQIVKVFRHTLATGERYVSPRFSEYRHDLGENKAYEWELQRVDRADGQHAVVCYFNDITEKLQSEQALINAKAAAEAANRAKDDFLAALSHELRTPLNPALLIASEAADNHELPEEVRLNFDKIRKNIELEARLIDDLLDLTRITAGKMALDRNLVDVHDILSDALLTIQAEQQEKRIALSVNFQAERSLVDGDAVRLQQVFWNVLKNAVKFTPPNGQITIATADGNASRLTIRITDTGLGMNSAELARAFGAFMQGDHAGTAGTHRFGGLGLGLAISAKLVELHSGKITAQSAGRHLGSSFQIELPSVGSSVGQRSGRNSSEGNGGAVKLNGHTAPASVLLVEDHEITRSVLAQLLARRNYHVFAADCVAKARELADRHKFDLLICDIGLPDGNGHDLMNEIREKYGLKGIALTGYGMEEDIARGRAAGFVTHLIKPVRIQSLENALALVRSIL